MPDTFDYNGVFKGFLRKNGTDGWSFADYKLILPNLNWMRKYLRRTVKVFRRSKEVIGVYLRYTEGGYAINLE